MAKKYKEYDLKFDDVVGLLPSEEEGVVEQIELKVEELCKKDGFDIEKIDYQWTISINLKISQG